MTPKLIILEGPDCCGKSALARFIARVLPAAYMHATCSKELALAMPKYHASMISDARLTMQVANLSVVLDRHWPSEWCYGRALRPHVMNYPFTHMWQHMKELDIRYVLCLSEFEKCYARQLTDSANVDHVYSRDEYFKVYNEYVNLADEWEEFGLGEKLHSYSIEENGAHLKEFVEELVR